jgi:hypothetical protein
VSRHDYLFGRRDILRIGGFGVATAAVITACGADRRGRPGWLGVHHRSLPDAVVTNITLLRTASSLERSIVNVYSQVIGNSDLLDPSMDDLFQRYLDDHTAHATLFEAHDRRRGTVDWQPKFDDVVVSRCSVASSRACRSRGRREIPPSDDPRRHPQLCPWTGSDGRWQLSIVRVLYSDPLLRASSMTVGATNRARRSTGVHDQRRSPRWLGQLQRCRQRRAGLAADNVDRPARPCRTSPSAPGGGSVDSEPAVPQTEIPTVSRLRHNSEASAPSRSSSAQATRTAHA